MPNQAAQKHRQNLLFASCRIAYSLSVLIPTGIGFVLTLLSCGDAAPVAQPVPPSETSFFSWIQDQSDIHMELTFAWDSLMVHRESEKPFEAQCKIVGGLSTEIPVKISSRGVNRKEICDFPPLRLSINKDYVKKQGWSTPRKYKLVTQCASGGDHLYREYLVYKLQELHTDYFLKTVLVPVTYHRGEETVEGHVILIEHEKEMARRLDFQLQEPDIEPVKLINQTEYERLVLFQYLIGNTDWNLTRGHNIKWLSKSDGSISPIPVAYDFDLCGLVDAPYAKPYPSLPITAVRERFLQYRGKDKERLRAPFDEMVVKREDVLQAIASTPNLRPESKVEISRFLEACYLEGLP